MRSSLRLIGLFSALLVGMTGGVQATAHPLAASHPINIRPAAGPIQQIALAGTDTLLAEQFLAHRSVVPHRTVVAHHASTPVAKTQKVSVTKPKAAPAPAPRPVTHASAPVPSRAHTGWAALDDAINHIRTYYPGIATWHVVDKGAWGATDLGTGDIYIAPRTPVDKLLSVVEHEYMHALTGHMYGGYYSAQAVADRLFGQSGEMGLEIEADCMARVDGATWTWYTACTNPAWRATAAALLTGRKL
jgi:hypothetical protein